MKMLIFLLLRSFSLSLLITITATPTCHAFVGTPQKARVSSRIPSKVSSSSRFPKARNLQPLQHCIPPPTLPTPLQEFAFRNLVLFHDYQLSEAADEATAEEEFLECSSLHPVIRLEASSSSGIDPNHELPNILNAISEVCNEYGLVFDSTKIHSSNPSYCASPLPAKPTSVPGATGRVLELQIHGLPAGFDVEEDEFLMQVKIDFSEAMDGVLFADDGTEWRQPILLSLSGGGGESQNGGESGGESGGDSGGDSGDVHVKLGKLIEKEVSDYGLRDEIGTGSLPSSDDGSDASNETEMSFIPSVHVKIDGAMIQNIQSPDETIFDTSSVVVFDNLLDESLRKRLLNVVKGIPENADTDEWNDVEHGPNPNRWVRGGLMDVVDESNENAPSCWGLTDEAIVDICSPHPAISEFETKLANLFSDFIVTRLPEAVLGACVSPLTANAPTHGDSFNYHIDADPLQVPSSPWADVFGRYPNRSRGKPRFVSCLLYLNEEWDGEAWGAPTEFLDPPTEEVYRVLPQPGRCVIMDQDVSHTVVAPNAAAGRRPRYSLVWKLILHPKVEGQDMSDLSCGRDWADPLIIGSANC